MCRNGGVPYEEEAKRTMKQSIIKGDIKVVDNDLAKTVFHLHAVDGKGHVVLRKKLLTAPLIQQ